jgi:hypothetical protein
MDGPREVTGEEGKHHTHNGLLVHEGAFQGLTNGPQWPHSFPSSYCRFGKGVDWHCVSVVVAFTCSRRRTYDDLTLDSNS